MAETWTVDPTIGIHHLHVIESLSGGFAGRTGTRLFEELESLCAATSVKPKLHRVAGSLASVLTVIASDAERGDVPLLHVETHGIDTRSTGTWVNQGIVLASGEAITWRQLVPMLTPIYEATRLRLIVFMAACNGGDLATVLQPLQRAPLRVVVGPMTPLSVGAVEKATVTYLQDDACHR